MKVFLIKLALLLPTTPSKGPLMLNIFLVFTYNLQIYACCVQVLTLQLRHFFMLKHILFLNIYEKLILQSLAQEYCSGSSCEDWTCQQWFARLLFSMYLPKILHHKQNETQVYFSSRVQLVWIYSFPSLILVVLWRLDQLVYS